MSEETHNAASLGPLAIQNAVLVSGAMGWMLTVCLCFCVTDLNDILNTPTGLPAAQIFLNAGGKTGGTIMWGLATLVQFFTGCSAMLADTRMAYAFARDDALPFSSYAPIPIINKSESANMQYKTEPSLKSTQKPTHPSTLSGSS